MFENVINKYSSVKHAITDYFALNQLITTVLCEGYRGRFDILEISLSL